MTGLRLLGRIWLIQRPSQGGSWRGHGKGGVGILPRAVVRRPSTRLGQQVGASVRLWHNEGRCRRQLATAIRRIGLNAQHTPTRGDLGALLPAPSGPPLDGQLAQLVYKWWHRGTMWWVGSRRDELRGDPGRVSSAHGGRCPGGHRLWRRDVQAALRRPASRGSELAAGAYRCTWSCWTFSAACLRASRISSAAPGMGLESTGRKMISPCSFSVTGRSPSR